MRNILRSFEASLRAFRASGASLVAIMVFDELARTEPASEGLALLTRLVDKKSVKPIVAVEAPWTDIR
jgi:hypothetical protein